jgi:hypothetical protein
MAKPKPAISARAAADRYVDRIARHVAERWPDLAKRLVAAYPSHLNEPIGLAEATLAAAGVGMQEARTGVAADIADRLRTAAAAALTSRFEHGDAAAIGASYDELWTRTGDPRAIGLGFVMRVIGDDPGDAGGGRPIIHFTVEKILGGAIVEAASGAWSEILSENAIEP